MTDLHIHTTSSSDGQHSPQEIIEMARLQGLAAISFTDHMDISSIPVGLKYAAPCAFDFFPGVELSTWYEGKEYHLLLYCFTPGETTLTEFLRDSCSRIWDHAAILIGRFRSQGFDITRDDVRSWGKSVPTGVSFLDALKKRNAHDRRLTEYLHGDKASSPYLNFYQDFSLTDLSHGLNTVLPDLVQTLDLFQEKGIPILAHPGKISEDVLDNLKDHGLLGVEAYSSHHDEETAGHLVKLSRKLGLHISAGSDFHGELIKPGIRLGAVSGTPDPELISLLKRRMSPWA
ncbi:MAG: PHP domain-containing protein [Desulfomonilia bacterium]